MKAETCGCYVILINYIIYNKVVLDYKFTYILLRGYAVALQTGRSRVRFQMVSLEFSIDIILLAALWSSG